MSQGRALFTVCSDDQRRRGILPRQCGGTPHRLLCLVLILSAVPGCILGNRPTFVHTSAIADEKTFFLDGAGNFGFGKETVPLGLADAGYHGQVEHFIWTTYWGPIYDQMSITHNRRKAAELARQIEAHLDLHPSGKVNIIALSAGSGVAVFALEVLGSDYRVDNVVLLSSSLSAEYDLTRALKHVRGGMYFFWSPDDPILKRLVPIVGSVDQEGSTPLAAGVAGASPPVRASRETMQLYRQRVHNVKWEPEILVGPVKYWHAGSITRSMIRELVAPIIVGKAPETPRPIPSPQIRRAGGSKPTTPRPTVSTPTGSQGPEVTGPPLPYAEHWVR